MPPASLPLRGRTVMNFSSSRSPPGRHEKTSSWVYLGRGSELHLQSGQSLPVARAVGTSALLSLALFAEQPARSAPNRLKPRHCPPVGRVSWGARPATIDRYLVRGTPHRRNRRQRRVLCLGGHSPGRHQAYPRVREAFSLDVPLRMISEAPTIAEFADALARARSEGKAG